MASIKFAAHVVATAENQDVCRDDSLKKSMFNTPVSEWSMVPPSLKTHGSNKSAPVRSSHQLSEREKQRRAELIARAKEKREALIKQIRCEKKLMFFSSCVALISAFIWIIAVSTDFWYGVTADESKQSKSNSTVQPLKVFVSSHTGVWKMCRTHRSNNTDETWCKPHPLFPDQEEIRRDPGLDEHVVDYTRTTTIFAVISLFTMAMSLFSAFYTFKNSRYVYKRLAAGIYFITTLTVLVVLEVTITLLRYEKTHVPFKHPEGSSSYYGFSFHMGWAVFFVYLLNGCIFLVLSRKRKGEKEDGTIEDGLRIIGR
ncbi:unnamed protein product [Allacma fusca]|uniref:Uncharacterized protein n=1 Tax=Allacma fusca TaxID=39272 RepID=A0A8J2NI37_9HEXA|nr:unnamed protein product [Allacma fusca]